MRVALHPEQSGYVPESRRPCEPPDPLQIFLRRKQPVWTNQPCNLSQERVERGEENQAQRAKKKPSRCQPPRRLGRSRSKEPIDQLCGRVRHGAAIISA